METASRFGGLVRNRRDGERRWFFGGGVHTWMATAEETDGAFLLFEIDLVRGKLTPLHIHPDSEESLYVLEGEIRLYLDGDEHRVTAGGLAVAARGVPHAFLVTSPTARLLCLHTPGCCQAFYLDASEPIAPDAPGDGAVSFDRVRESAQCNGGIEIIGPPPFAPTVGG